MSAAEREPERPVAEAELVPHGLRVVAAWAWRWVAVAAAGYVVLRGLAFFEVLVVPVLVALLVSALLWPGVQALARGPQRRGLPRGLAAAVVMLLALVVLGGLFTLIGQQLATGFGDLRVEALRGWHELERQLRVGDFPIDLGRLLQNGTEGLPVSGRNLVTGALLVGTRAADVLTGFFVVLFSTFFFLSGGEGIWGWVLRLFPRGGRARVHGAGLLAWGTLTSFVRATIVVALVDGVGVGLVALLLGVPLAAPLGAVVFVGAFVPVVGSLVSGSVAVLVALVARGPVLALAMLAGVVVVHQLEAHVLQPFLMGRAVRVHPLAVILSIGAGVVLAGIVGGLFAVPLAAVVNVVANYLRATAEADLALRDGGPPGEDRGGADPAPGGR